MWLLDHGADSSWIHPIFRTTPTHLIARFAVAEAYEECTLTFVLRADAANGLHWTQSDNCICRCSQDGCLAISCAVSRYAPKPRPYRQVPCPTRRAEAFRRHKILPEFFSYIDRIQTSKAMGTAVLRLLTFEALSLTHTCCAMRSGKDSSVQP
jgi:hypothetical protein